VWRDEVLLGVRPLGDGELAALDAVVSICVRE
jgi:hypothetical protein